MKKPYASERIAAFVAALSIEDVDANVLGALKCATTDCFASILSSVDEPVSKKIVARILELKPAEATVLGRKCVKVPMPAAALANGVMAHATEYDDVSPSMWGHATAPVLPAVLAVSEHLDLSGEHFLIALLAGLEVELRLGAAIAPGHYLAGWHATSTVGVFGATAGAARALDSDAASITAGLGIATSRAAGLRVNFGSMTKPLHVGFAARDGLEAALLARDGVTSRPGAIDDSFGFLDVMGGGRHTLDEMLSRLGKPFDIVGNGLCYKLYPSCADTHIAVDTLLDVMAELRLQAADLQRIRVGVTQNVSETLNYHRPRNGLEGKFSLEFCLARAANTGLLELEDFKDEVILAPDVQQLMDRIEVYADQSLDDGSFFPPILMHIDTPAGQICRRGTTARGQPGRPMELPAFERKFENCARRVLSSARTRAALNALSKLEEIKSMRTLISDLMSTTD